MTPVGEGMMLPEVAWSPHQSLWEGESPTAWVAFMELTMVLRASCVLNRTSLGWHPWQWSGSCPWWDHSRRHPPWCTGESQWWGNHQWTHKHSPLQRHPYRIPWGNIIGRCICGTCSRGCLVGWQGVLPRKTNKMELRLVELLMKRLLILYESFGRLELEDLSDLPVPVVEEVVSRYWSELWWSWGS